MATINVIFGLVIDEPYKSFDPFSVLRSVHTPNGLKVRKAPVNHLWDVIPGASWFKMFVNASQSNLPKYM